MAVSFQGDVGELRALLLRLPRILAGVEADVGGIARSLQLRLGVALLSKVQQAFIEKSRGGVGGDGIRWAPLRPETIAARRITAGEKKAAGVGGKRTRGLLNRAEDAQWRKIFGTRKAALMLRGLGEQEASARAAQIAWAELKRLGAKTRLGTFGNRKVDILRDTGRLFRSLSPGIEDRPSGAQEQRFEIARGQVIVGTNVPYASHLHRRRPLWPDRLPEAWVRDLAGTYARGLARLIGLLVAKGVTR